MLTPNRTFSNGDVIKFWTRNPADNPFPDRLEVRFSSNGASTNVGTGPAGIGDFTTVLQTINPDLTVGGYPEVWTEFTITISGLPAPTSGRVAFRYWVTGGGPTGDNSNYIGIDTFSYTPGGVVNPAADQALDYNDDGKTDYVVVRNTGGGPGGQITWYVNLNGVGGTQVTAWGSSGDEYVSGDFDGDGKDDIAVWRPSNANFYILNSNGLTLRQEQFGQSGDDPSIVNDYNGDGTDDIAVYRAGVGAGDQSTWYFRTAPNGPVNFAPWGQNGDFPIPGDFDGNGTADLTVQRNAGGGNAAFWTRLSTGAITTTIFGSPTDSVTPGDYDGDGKTDLCVARTIGGTWYWFYISSQSGATVAYVPHGISATDFPAQGDYDGDGRTDFAVWRQDGVFWVKSTGSGTVSAFSLGSTGDYPVANYNVH